MLKLFLIGSALLLPINMSRGNVVGKIDPVCVPGPWVVFFDKNSLKMERKGVAIVDNMAWHRQFCPDHEIFVTGYSNMREDSDIDFIRAAKVRRLLIDRKVPKRLISIRGAGQPEIAREAPKSSYQDGRVEIVLSLPD